MSEEVQKRFTYYGQKDRTARGEITHLRFVISDFKFDDDTHKECALVVNMTSCHNSSKDDKTCLLHPRDHEDVIHDSYIEYSMAERVEKSYILENIEKGFFVPRELISESLLKRMQEGVLSRLDDMPDFVENYLDVF